MERYARAVAAVAGAFFLLLGAWAFFDPPSFGERIATFPPLNVHFLRDAGAFQIGLATALLLGLARRDGLLVALGGAAAAATCHAIGHVIDVDRGGEPVRDLVTLWLLAVALLVAAAWRWRETRP